MAMRLTPPQSEIFCNPARFRNCVAGRRFGKTHLSVTELLQAATSGKNKNCWYVAPTYGAAKEIAWDMLVHTIPEEYIIKSNESALTLKLINGSVISLKGAEKPNNLRGRALDFVVLDEFADMRPEAWYEVIRPSLSDRQGSALFIGTPKGRNHFYDLWANGMDGAEGWASFQYTTLQGGNVPKEEVEAARIDLDQRTFNQEYCAEFITYSGIIYYSFNRQKNVVKCKDDGGTIHIGMDFNIDPMSSIISNRRGNDLFIFDEIFIYSSNTDEMVQEIKHRYPNRRIIVYPDPASKQRKTSAGGKTDLSILKNAGFEIKVRKSHPLVRDRINAVNSRYCTSDNKQHIFIDPSCKHTIKAAERQTYKEGTSIPNKDGLDHPNDALGYKVEYLFPLVTYHENKDPERYY
jgi:hypothetical protein